MLFCIFDRNEAYEGLVERNSEQGLEELNFDFCG